MIALGTYQLVPMAVSHSLAQLWEAGLEALGLRQVLGLSTGLSIGLSLLVNTVYVGLGAIFAR